MRPLLALFGLVLCLSCAEAARADVLPPPTRPEWNDPPAPLPEPLEDDAWRWLVPIAVLAAAGTAAVHLRRTARSAT